MNQLIKLTTIMLAIIFSSGCEAMEPEPETISGTAGIYILCEGAFGSETSSLWHLDSDLDTLTANVFQGLTDDPLGDTGQSLYSDGEALYIVVNGSGKVEVLDLSGEEPVYQSTIDLSGSSPRDMVVVGSTGYVTAWNVGGVLVVNLSTGAVTDTIMTNGSPEDILTIDGQLYVAVPYDSDFLNGTQVHKISPATNQIVTSYSVGTGPTQLLAEGTKLYVSRIWYDATYTSYRGISQIDLASGTVTSVDWGAESGGDIFSASGAIYVTMTAGVTPLRADLTLDNANSLAATLGTSYAGASDGEHIFVASYTDFSTAGEVAIYDLHGDHVKTVSVGLGPGSFAFYSQE